MSVWPLVAEFPATFPPFPVIRAGLGTRPSRQFPRCRGSPAPKPRRTTRCGRPNWRNPRRRARPGASHGCLRKPVRLRDPTSVHIDGALPLTYWEPWMDLIDLYRRHQIELFLAENAPSAKSRAVHRALIADYALKIAEAKRERARPGMFA